MMKRRYKRFSYWTIPSLSTLREILRGLFFQLIFLLDFVALITEKKSEKLPFNKNLEHERLLKFLLFCYTNVVHTFLLGLSISFFSLF